ncbi:hypothetical protein BDW59DRAFT_161556 [Aspergillus cavernicola]|uniref:C2H2-type domain-containing protein n=1 Tax=Aspergillus cavernicola TaxID=176166 RepID=A0ABR4ICZ1_9EURO
MHYGPLNAGDNIPFLTFIQGSNKAFPRDGTTVRHIRDILEHGRQTNRAVVLAVNGWDGLTTNSVALVSLFSAYADKIPLIMRVFLGGQGIFREASVKHVLMVLSGEYEGEYEDLALPNSTRDFISKFQAIAAIKTQASINAAELRAESANRNRVPDIHGNGWACPDCDDVLPTSERLCDHKHKHHSPGPAPACQFCAMVFKRKDHRDRHEKETCKRRPGFVALPPKRHAPRGSKSKSAKRARVAVGSDNSYPAYFQIEKNTLNFPRVDSDVPKEQRLVYKWEVFCRFPGCCWKTKFSDDSKLRTHYENAHSWDYLAKDPGEGVKAKREYEAAGADYLARCAHYGLARPELIGSPPLLSDFLDKPKTEPAKNGGGTAVDEGMSAG